MDGIKAAAIIRSASNSQDCVMILVTADLMAHDDEAVPDYFNHVILKPVTRAKVLPLLPQLPGRPALQPPVPSPPM